ncbi:hypothetical protein ACTXGL_05175 [Psychrobacter sp. T6-6]|uniref:hypothetical protein n=1 Tax=Psychrobacter sp. T6-6 TaxID=3457452 RepID=UPI003FD5F5B3
MSQLISMVLYLHFVVICLTTNTSAAIELLFDPNAMLPILAQLRWHKEPSDK